MFASRVGGYPDAGDLEVDAAYDRASPADFADGLRAPLFALHGSGDPNVPFAQMDQLVQDLVEHGADFELAYHPAEDYMFEKPSTWTDALSRVLPFFDTHLVD